MPHAPQRTTTREAILRYLLTNPTEQRGSQLEATLHLTSGGLYPALSDLEQQLCLTSRDEAPGGPAAARLYRLTAAGTAAARELPQTPLAEVKPAISAAKRARKKRGAPRRSSIPIWLVVVLSSFFIPGVLTGAHQIVFQLHSVATTATVVGSVSYRDTGKGACPHDTAYHASAAFTIDGEAVSDVIENVHYCTPPMNGTVLHIRYRTDDPTVAQTDDGSNWMVPILELVGAGLLSISVFLSARRYRQRRSRAGTEGDSGPS